MSSFPIPPPSSDDPICELNNDCASIYISKKLKCLHKRDCACMNDVNHD